MTARVLPWAIALAFAGLLLVERCGGGEPALPPDLAGRVDSLAGTQASDSLERDSLRIAARQARAAARESEALAARLRAQSVEAGRRADSLAIVAAAASQGATHRDSGGVAWRAAYEARTVERDLLVVGNDSLTRANAQLRVASLADSTRAAQAEARLAVYERTLPAVVDVVVRRHRWRWLERLGVQIGYGAVASRDGSVAHGLTVSAGVRVWP